MQNKERLNIVYHCLSFHISSLPSIISRLVCLLVLRMAYYFYTERNANATLILRSVDSVLVLQAIYTHFLRDLLINPLKVKHVCFI